MTEATRTTFWLRRLHSLSGAVPLVVFLLAHLTTNAAALWGQRSYDTWVERVHALPGLAVLEIFGLLVPLAVHAGLGIWLSRSASPSLVTYPFARSWSYVLQRVSGVAVLVFLVVHLWEFRVQKWLFGMDTRSFYPALAAGLSSTRWGIPWRALLYVGGLLAVCVHLANGLFGFACTWGLVVSRRAQVRWFALTAALGVLAFVVGTSTVLHFATGPFWSPPTQLGAAGAECRQLPSEPQRAPGR